MTAPQLFEPRQGDLPRGTRIAMTKSVMRVDQNVHDEQRTEPDLSVGGRGPHDSQHAVGPDRVVRHNLPHDCRRGATEVVLLLICAVATTKKAPPFWVPNPRSCTPRVKARTGEGHLELTGGGRNRSSQQPATIAQAP